MTDFIHTFEGGTDGTTLTTSNTGTAGDTAFNTVSATGWTFSSTGAFAGLLGGRISFASSTTWRAYDQWTGNTQVAGRVGFCFNGSVVNTVAICGLVNASFGTAMKVGVNSASQFVVQNSAGSTLATSTGTLSANTGYYIEIQCSPGTSTTTGTANVQLYAASAPGTSLLNFSTTTANLGGGTSTTIVRGQLGNNDTVAALDLTFDNVLWRPGTLTAVGPPPTTGTGSLTFSASGTAKAPATASASLSLSATGTPSVSNTGTGSLSLSGSATATATPVASGSLTFGATGTATASSTPTTGTASLSFNGSAVPTTLARPYLYVPPCWRNVVPMANGGVLRVSFETSTCVYRRDGVWHNVLVASENDVSGLDVWVNPGDYSDTLLLFFPTPTPIPAALYAELSAVAKSDPSWSDPQLITLTAPTGGGSPAGGGGGSTGGGSTGGGGTGGGTGGGGTPPGGPLLTSSTLTTSSSLETQG